VEILNEYSFVKHKLTLVFPKGGLAYAECGHRNKNQANILIFTQNITIFGYDIIS
jgi:hypothetical protein